MNIVTGCPCGSRFETTHISTKYPEAIEPAIALHRRWELDHYPHQLAAMKNREKQTVALATTPLEQAWTLPGVEAIWGKKSEEE